jgi:hypothetical protein
VDSAAHDLTNPAEERHEVRGSFSDPDLGLAVGTKRRDPFVWHMICTRQTGDYGTLKALEAV